MIGWVETHGIEVLVMYYIFAAFSGGMPTPADDSGMGYRWLFSSLSILNASLARLAATQFPSSKLGQSLQNAQPVQDVVTKKTPDAGKVSDGIAPKGR